LGIFKRIQFH